MSFGIAQDDKYVAAAGPAVPGKQYVGTKITPLVSTGEERWHTVQPGSYEAYTYYDTFVIPEDGLYYLFGSMYRAWALNKTDGAGYVGIDVAGITIIDAELKPNVAPGACVMDAVVVPFEKGTGLNLRFQCNAGTTDNEFTYRPYFYIAKIEEELV